MATGSTPASVIFWRAAASPSSLILAPLRVNKRRQSIEKNPPPKQRATPS